MNRRIAGQARTGQRHVEREESRGIEADIHATQTEQTLAKQHGAAVVGHTFKHGVSAGFLADLVVTPGDSRATRALLARSLDEVRGGADALVLLPPPGRAERRALARSGFAPTNKKLRFIGKVLRDGASLDGRAEAWHFTLGDFDFF